MNPLKNQGLCMTFVCLILSSTSLAAPLEFEPRPPVSPVKRTPEETALIEEGKSQQREADFQKRRQRAIDDQVDRDRVGRVILLANLIGFFIHLYFWGIGI